MTCVLCTFIDMRKKDRPIFFQNDSFDKMYLDTCENQMAFISQYTQAYQQQFLTIIENYIRYQWRENIILAFETRESSLLLNCDDFYIAKKAIHYYVSKTNMDVAIFIAQTLEFQILI